MRGKWSSMVRKNYIAVITRGIPALFVVYTVLSTMFQSDSGSNFWSLLFPVFITEMGLNHQLPRLIQNVFSLAPLIFLFIPCNYIATRNRGRFFPWVVVIVYSVDVIGLICAFIAGAIKISQAGVWLVILAELTLVVSQIINLIQKDKLGR